MTKKQGVIGVFSYVDSALDAVRKLKKAGFSDIRVFSPVPNHEIEDELKESESIVRFFTLTGATVGALCGLGFTILTSLAWPIHVSAKPIVSIPPFMIIVFELAVLLGALSNFVGLLINSRLRNNAPVALYDERFSDDKFGVAVVCTDGTMARVQDILQSSGAEDVKFEGV
ncbi:MAG: DUF3341 domain-containing protein [Deltaproteobacteria bacterium]